MSRNVKLSESEKRIVDSYSKEIYLWKDPFEAPSVPPENVFKRFLEDQADLEHEMPGISRQIFSDINCKRAYAKLNAPNDELYKAVFGNKPELYAVSGSENKCESEEQEGFVSKLTRVFAPTPHKGDIFYTESKLLKIEDGKSSFVYTFKPCAVLLLDGGEETPWNDKVFQCAVVTPASDEKEIPEQDMKLENGWILHKWLCYQVSVNQIDRTRKAGKVDNIDEIAEAVDNYTVSDMEKMDFGRGEKRLLAMANYLPIVADTEFKLFDMKETVEDSVFNRFQKRFHKFISECYEKLVPYLQPFELPAAAAGDKDSTLVIRSGENAEPECFTAALKGIIRINADNYSALEEENRLPMWSLDTGDEKINLDGRVFTLREAETKQSIGFGYIKKNIAYLEQILPDKLSEPINKASQVILEVCI